MTKRVIVKFSDINTCLSPSLSIHLAQQCSVVVIPARQKSSHRWTKEASSVPITVLLLAKTPPQCHLSYRKRWSTKEKLEGARSGVKGNGEEIYCHLGWMNQRIVLKLQHTWRYLSLTFFLDSFSQRTYNVVLWQSIAHWVWPECRYHDYPIITVQQSWCYDTAKWCHPLVLDEGEAKCFHCVFWSLTLNQSDGSKSLPG